jgi:colicin import membrane protein
VEAIAALLSWDPRKRPGAAEALHLPFFAAAGAEEPLLPLQASALAEGKAGQEAAARSQAAERQAEIERELREAACADAAAAASAAAAAGSSAAAPARASSSKEAEDSEEEEEEKREGGASGALSRAVQQLQLKLPAAAEAASASSASARLGRRAVAANPLGSGFSFASANFRAEASFTT